MWFANQTRIMRYKTSSCGIDKESDKAFMFKKEKLIISDEAPIMHRYCFEAFD